MCSAIWKSYEELLYVNEMYSIIPKETHPFRETGLPGEMTSAL